MAYKRLEQSLIDIVKEEQAKLGYRKEEVRLYYPLSTEPFLSGKRLCGRDGREAWTFAGRHEREAW